MKGGGTKLEKIRPLEQLVRKKSILTFIINGVNPMKKRFLTLGAILVVLMFVASPAMSATLTATSTLNSTTVTWSGLSSYQPTSSSSITLSNTIPQSSYTTANNNSQYLDSDSAILNPQYTVPAITSTASLSGVTGNASATAYYAYAGVKAASASLTFDGTALDNLPHGRADAGYLGYFSSGSWYKGVSNGVAEPTNGSGIAGKFSVNATVSATGDLSPKGTSTIGLIVQAYYLASDYTWVEAPLQVGGTNFSPENIAASITGIPAGFTLTREVYGKTILGDDSYAYYFKYNLDQLIAEGGSKVLTANFDFFYDGTSIGVSNGVRINVVPFVDATVPIPGAIWLLGSGLIGLLGFRKNMKK